MKKSPHEATGVARWRSDPYKNDLVLFLCGFKRLSSPRMPVRVIDTAASSTLVCSKKLASMYILNLVLLRGNMYKHMKMYNKKKL